MIQFQHVYYYVPVPIFGFVDDRWPHDKLLELLNEKCKTFDAFI